MKLLKVFAFVFLFFLFSSNNSFAQNYNDIFIKNRILELHPEESKNLSSFPLNELSTLTMPKKYRVPILMYHYIGSRDDTKDATRSALSTWPNVLEAQIKTLKEAGYTFLTNQELSRIIENNSELAEKSVILTFDDSYKDFYTEAYQILKNFGAKATLYTITGLLNHPNHLSFEELIELSKDERIEIASHTVHHGWLKDQNSLVYAFEVAESKKELESLTKKEVVSFAYPYGAFDGNSIAAVKSAGFSSAVTTLPGVEQSTSNKFTLYRIRPGERTGELLLEWLSQDNFSAF